MSASEKLKALGEIWGSDDEAVTYEQVGRSAETVRLALPQIVAVVEAQENGKYPFHDHEHSTEYGENVAYPVSRHSPTCRRCAQDAALAALDEALEGDFWRPTGKCPEC